MGGPKMIVDDRTYRMLVAAVIDYAIYLLDPEGRISSWDAGAQATKGYSAEEVIGQPFSIFFTEEDRRLGRPEAILEAARRDGRFESEGWRVRKDGTHFWALAVLDAIHDDDGRLIGFAKITRDMTQRHIAQQALLESERRFHLLVQGVTDYAIYMLDPEGTITNWNSGASRIKGYSADEIVGQHFSRFYTDEDRAAGLPRRSLAEAEAAGKFEAEGWRVRKDGSRFWANVVIDAIRSDDGRLIGFAKVTRDITERREAQRALEETREQLAQSQRLEALGQLTGGIAHDFNNLLQVVSGGVALAEKLAVGHPRLGHILSEMRNAAARGTAVTRQLLAFSRRAPIRPEVVDTAESIQRAVDLFSGSLGGDIQVDLKLGNDLWPIRVDVAHFDLALLNIAVNARDAMPKGGLLRVTATNMTLNNDRSGLTGQVVAIRLHDTGMGIPQEVLGRIFEPFFTTKPMGKGTGLGLSQVHGFARQAGGAVTITSKPDEGTEVTLLLPAAPLAELRQRQEAAEQTAENSRQTHQGLRVLVVDDDDAVVRLTAGMLEAAGHLPVCATDPRVALDLLAAGEQFDMVLSDVAMPGGMSGVDLGQAIKKRWAELPVLLTTGYAMSADAIQREFPLLHKPFTMMELTRTIEALVRRRVAVART